MKAISWKEATTPKVKKVELAAERCWECGLPRKCAKECEHCGAQPLGGR